VHFDVTKPRKDERIEMDVSVWHIVVSDDGGTLFVACEGRTGRIMDMTTKKVVTLKGHTESVRRIVPCEDTDVLTCSHDRTIRRWNRSTGECIRVYSANTQTSRSILYDKKRKEIYSACEDYTIKVWNADTGDIIREISGHKHIVRSLVWVNSDNLVSCSNDGTIRLWDAATKTEVRTMTCGVNLATSLAVTPCGQFILSGLEDGSVRLWSVATGECIEMPNFETSPLYRAAISSNGRFIAFAYRSLSSFTSM
jgi:WD40 repeat protein